jgi:hypothetical protein
VYLVGMYIYWK